MGSQKRSVYMIIAVNKRCCCLRTINFARLTVFPSKQYVANDCKCPQTVI